MVATATASSATLRGRSPRGLYDGNVTPVGGYAGATTPRTANSAPSAVSASEAHTEPGTPARAHRSAV
jgi:hypothetical protein